MLLNPRLSTVCRKRDKRNIVDFRVIRLFIPEAYSLDKHVLMSNTSVKEESLSYKMVACRLEVYCRELKMTKAVLTAGFDC